MHATGIGKRGALLLVIAACGLVAAVHPGAWLDLKLLDLEFRQLRAHTTLAGDDSIVIVGIDEASVRAVPEPMTLWHRPLAVFLHGMALAQPKAVGIDLVLPERSYDAVLPGADKTLLRGLLESRRVAPVVLAITKEPGGRARPIHQLFLTAVGDGNAAYALWPIDRDGVVRRFDERLGEDAQRVPTLAGRLIQLAGAAPGEGLIDFSRGADLGYIPFKDVVDLAERNDAARLQQLFRGRIVLLGALLPFVDRHAMPVNIANWEEQSSDAPAIVLYAQAIRTAASDGFVREMPAFAAALLTMLCALGWFVSARGGGVAAIFLGASAAAVAASTTLLAHGVHLPMADPLIALAAALVARFAWDTSGRLAERLRLRRSFGGYVSPGVLDSILSGKLSQGLGGTRQRIAIFFADVRGFTKRSEAMRPEEVIGMLNGYFERVTAAIHKHGGTVDKFMGDGIMAFFGAPNSLGNASQSAVDAAADMVSGVAELNRELTAEGLPPIAIGIGIHSGDAVVGHVGSAARHEYTAIGDAVNVASRLEGATKDCGHTLVVSRDVFEELHDTEGWTYLGQLELKGHSPVASYGKFRITEA
jgi:adenylate cyclase